ncbi:glycoside hydrolase family 9 protein [Sphingomonas sp. AOB5]|uniref:glycoside hydrolase family 9 protein n=1 Tax=Sphingomonas sp. AOB5 TaxID=3034017 RepID=UPI0023F9104B|nr:glycoside hydrolase family 9 protein [Sphingomonas sp. AOB5]MDF7776555.1 glycoside hydrolase family 9 protein [Sphingomonas sp. AOB5]
MLRRVAPLALAILLAGAAEPVSPIRLNQLGFAPNGPKRAMLASDSTKPLDWQLRDASGKVIRSGKTIVHGADPLAGEAVHIIDISAFTYPGKGYTLRSGSFVSRPFDIAPNTRGNLAKDALAFFYHQRAGVPIEARYVGARWARPAGHVVEIAPCFAGKDQRGIVWPGCGYTLDVKGGWYDAGDHGKYVVNGGIALWTLQNAYEHLKSPAFADGKLPIPEAGNGVNDLLDEARFEMEFMLAMQVPQGTRALLPVGHFARGASVTLTEVDASGMAHLKVADRNWTALPMRPADDKEDRLLYPPTISATLNLAATAGQCARIWKGIDDAFAARCLTAARRAWDAAKRNPEIYATGDFTGSGGYGDNDVSDEFYWAAAELFATTGAAEFGDFVRKSPHHGADTGEPGWPRTAALGTIALATLPEASPERDTARAALIKLADRFAAVRERTGYRIPYVPSGYPWGSTSNLMNRAIVLAYAFDFTRDAKYRHAVVDAMDYLLGRNPLDQSYVSGYGARPMAHPHHRFWAPSLDPALPGPPPGVLSGGPNSTGMADPVAQAMKGRCAPMRCYADDVNAYALNEVAINWNAPLFWVAAWLDR